jgi:hypothetical protein
MPQHRDFDGPGFETLAGWVTSELDELREAVQQHGTALPAQLEAMDMFGAMLIMLRHMGVGQPVIAAWFSKQLERGRTPMFDPHYMRRLLRSMPDDYLPITERPAEGRSTLELTLTVDRMIKAEMKRQKEAS